GIVVSRFFVLFAEKMADEKGLVIHSDISPYKYYLIGIGDEGMRAAEEIYARAPEKFIFDDRDERPGVKFADAELIGIPERVVVSDKTLRDGKIEVVTRANGATKLLTKEEFLSKLS
ncbi:prolyl-tRNA synthetase, partial [Candidatus Saccharibacteria bacterium]|nr:prolyl-tRNA synthetase [Candidatus Saccharibacteria bacterium]